MFMSMWRSVVFLYDCIWPVLHTLLCKRQELLLKNRTVIPVPIDATSFCLSDKFPILFCPLPLWFWASSIPSYVQSSHGSRNFPFFSTGSEVNSAKYRIRYFLNPTLHWIVYEFGALHGILYCTVFGQYRIEISYNTACKEPHGPRPPPFLKKREIIIRS